MKKAAVGQHAKIETFPPPARVLQRQCACGNHTIAGGECAECQQKRAGALQRSPGGLAISRPGDRYEQEADQVSSTIAGGGALPGTLLSAPVLQRNASESDDLSGVPPVVDDVLRSPGRPLDPATRAFMEPRFGQDFSDVRVHSDGQAAESARAVSANAYTVGRDVVFGAGQFQPHSSAGQRLMAHELAHVVQQSGSQEHAAGLNRAGSSATVQASVPPMLARQKAGETSKPQPVINRKVERQVDRTVISVNGVAIAETDALPGEVQFDERTTRWTPEVLEMVIVIPEGRQGNVIQGSKTEAVLAKISTRYTVAFRNKLKTARRTFNELEGGFGPLQEYETGDSLSGQRPKSAPAKKAPVPPPAPPQVAPPQVSPQPETNPPTQPGPGVQLYKPPPINLDLSQTQKYGKPKTEKEIAEENINRIIQGAMAGRSDIPPMPKGLEPKSVVDLIKQGVAEALKPLIKNLPKNAREFILDKIDSAIDEGIDATIDAALDTAKVDGETKGAIKKAVKAGIKLKPAQPGPAK